MVITEELVEKAGYQAMRNGVTAIPADIFSAMRDAYDKEVSADARRVYESWFEYVERHRLYQR